MRALVIGAGAVGGRACRQLVQDGSVEEVVLADRRRDRAQQLADQMGGRVRPATLDQPGEHGVDVAVVTVPAGHVQMVEQLLSHGIHVVSTVTSVAVARGLLDLDRTARDLGKALAVGAAFAPGLSCVLARHGSSGLDQVDEIEVSKAGAGGPACQAERSESLRPRARDGRGRPGVASGGRGNPELVWFPSPVGSVECRNAAQADEILLSPAFPEPLEVSVRASGRTRVIEAILRPLRARRHQLEAIGALRVELRGVVGTSVEMRVLGAVDRPSVAAGAVAAQAAMWATEGRLDRDGAGGLAELVADTVGFLGELAERGVKAASLGRAQRTSR